MNKYERVSPTRTLIQAMPGELVQYSTGVVYEVDRITKTVASLRQVRDGATASCDVVRANDSVFVVEERKPVVLERFVNYYSSGVRGGYDVVGIQCDTQAEAITAQLGSHCGGERPGYLATFKVTYTDDAVTAVELA